MDTVASNSSHRWNDLKRGNFQKTGQTPLVLKPRASPLYSGSFPSFLNFIHFQLYCGFILSLVELSMYTLPFIFFSRLWVSVNKIIYVTLLQELVLKVKNIYKLCSKTAMQLKQSLRYQIYSRCICFVVQKQINEYALINYSLVSNSNFTETYADIFIKVSLVLGQSLSQLKIWLEHLPEDGIQSDLSTQLNAIDGTTPSIGDVYLGKGLLMLFKIQESSAHFKTRNSFNVDEKHVI